MRLNLVSVLCLLCKLACLLFDRGYIINTMNNTEIINLCNIDIVDFSLQCNILKHHNI